MASPTITCTPEAPVAGSSHCRVEVTNTPNVDTTAYDDSGWVSPTWTRTEPELRYYLTFEPPAGATVGTGGVGYEPVRPVATAKSYEFSTSPDEGHVFNNFVFEVAGVWTIHLVNAGTDVDVTTLAVTVS